MLRRGHHPHLVRAFRSGVHEGLPYVVMEFLDGPSLLDSLNASGRRFPVGDAVRATFQIGSALAHLHRVGWLHLDVKPANVILRGGVPILTDLGSVRRTGGPRPARRPGTAPYMAPEQAARNVPTPATDVYGLGALLYELLTGRWPHEEALERTGPDDLPRTLAKPAPPVRRFRRVPVALATLVERALSPDPTDRFARMESFLEGLAPLVDTRRS